MDLAKLFKQRCKEEFKEYGFKTYRSNFYRVVNDVFQSFTLHRSVSGEDCTVEFCALPLCYGSDINKDRCVADHLKMFEGNFSWFEYDRHDESSIEACVEEMISYMRKYLMPFFTQAGNSYGAYHATWEFQRVSHNNKYSSGDSRLMYFALKCGMYEEVIKHLHAQIKNLEEVIEEDIKWGYFNRIEEIKNDILETQNQIKMISEPNEEWIKTFIAEKERAALLNLGMIKE